MKTNFLTQRKSEIRNGGFERRRRSGNSNVGLHFAFCILHFAFLLCLLPPARAVIPEPDNVVYGRIAIGTNLVTALRTNVMVEVRHSGDTSVFSTNVLASYRMGQVPSLGDFYAVTIPFWSLEETINPLPSPTGSNLVVVVKETVIIAHQTYTYLRHQTNFSVGERGYVLQLDLGDVPIEPTNAPTGYQAWAAHWGITNGNLDLDGDRYSNHSEWIAGTSPKDPNDNFRLSVTMSNEFAVVSFDALRAEGLGYEGVTRYYSLQVTTSAISGDWSPVAGCTNVLGDDQTVSCYLPVTNAAAIFFRGFVELRNP